MPFTKTAKFFRQHWPDKTVERALAKLGRRVGEHPVYFLSIMFLLAVIFAEGLQHFRIISNIEYLFSPINSTGSYERKEIETYFPTNYSDYVLGQATRFNAEAHMIIQPKDKGTIFRTYIWEEVFDLDERVVNEVVHSETGNVVTFEDVCAKSKGKCVRNEFLELKRTVKFVEEGRFNFTYPTLRNPIVSKTYVLAGYLGNISVSKGVLLNSTAFRLSYILDETKSSSRLWENAFLDFWARNMSLNCCDIVAVTSQSVEEELYRNLSNVNPRIPFAVIIVCIFIVLASRGMPFVMLLGTINYVVAMGGAFGLVMYLGYPWQAVNISSMFLLLGVGLDDVFVLASSWIHASDIKDVPGRMEETFRHAAVSITITSFTNAMSFLVGALLPGFHCVQIFSVYTGTGIFFIYIWTLTFFGACLALSEDTTVSYDRCVTWWRSTNLNEHLHACTDLAGQKIDRFRMCMSRFLNSGLGYCLVLLTSFIYWGLCLHFVFQLDTTFARQKLALDDSFLVDYYRTDDALFRSNNYRIQLAFTDTLNYSDLMVQTEINTMLRKLKESDFIDPNPDFKESWLDDFLDYHTKSSSNVQLADEATFCDELLEFFKLGVESNHPRNVVFNDDQTSIIASRIFLQTSAINNTIEEAKMVRKLREIVAEAPFNVIVFHPFFLYFDQFLLVTPTTLQCTLACAGIVICVTFLLIPSWRCSFWVVVTIISIEFGVLGVMGMAEISLDVISMISLIICVGFSVDFSAHISHSYMSHHGLDSRTRIDKSLELLGPPVLQSAISTILAVALLLFEPSYILRTFGIMMTTIMCLGVLHSIFLLPVLLSSNQRCCGRSKARHEIQRPSAPEENFGMYNQTQFDHREEKSVPTGVVNEAYAEEVSSPSTSDFPQPHESQAQLISNTSLLSEQEADFCQILECDPDIDGIQMKDASPDCSK